MASVTGNFQKSSSSSDPVNPLTRWMTFDVGNNRINDAVSKMNAPQYEGSAYVDPGAIKQLENGDYNRLEENILKSRTAGIDRAKLLDSQNLDANLAKRGIWSSGLAERAQGDNNERYAASYLTAGGDAATQRYGMQQQDLNASNAWNMTGAQNKNNWNLEQDNRKFQSAWAPLNYYAGLWNGTNGQVSRSDSFGMGGGVSVGGGKA